MKNMTLPEARKTLNIESVLKMKKMKILVYSLFVFFCPNSLWNCYYLQNVETDVYKYRAGEVGLQHLVPLFTVSLLQNKILCIFCSSQINSENQYVLLVCAGNLHWVELYIYFLINMGLRKLSLQKGIYSTSLYKGLTQLHRHTGQRLTVRVKGSL